MEDFIKIVQEKAVEKRNMLKFDCSKAMTAAIRAVDMHEAVLFLKILFTELSLSEIQNIVHWVQGGEEFVDAMNKINILKNT
jgi:hypothetical protein